MSVSHALSLFLIPDLNNAMVINANSLSETRVPLLQGPWRSCLLGNYDEQEKKRKKAKKKAGSQRDDGDSPCFLPMERTSVS